MMPLHGDDGPKCAHGALLALSCWLPGCDRIAPAPDGPRHGTTGTSARSIPVWATRAHRGVAVSLYCSKGCGRRFPDGAPHPVPCWCVAAGRDALAEHRPDEPCPDREPRLTGLGQ